MGAQPWVAEAPAAGLGVPVHDLPGRLAILRHAKPDAEAILAREPISLTVGARER